MANVESTATLAEGVAQLTAAAAQLERAAAAIEARLRPLAQTARAETLPGSWQPLSPTHRRDWQSLKSNCRPPSRRSPSCAPMASGPAPAGRKTLPASAASLLAKHGIDQLDQVNAGALDTALDNGLSLEQRIAVKSQLMRAGIARAKSSLRTGPPGLILAREHPRRI